jgi:hypothetical protein
MPYRAKHWRGGYSRTTKRISRLFNPKPRPFCRWFAPKHFEINILTCRLLVAGQAAARKPFNANIALLSQISWLSERCSFNFRLTWRS